MSQLKGFTQFINEDIMTGEELSPSHEELEKLPWFLHLTRFLEEFGNSANWVTGPAAYTRGNRRLVINSWRLQPHQDFHFYPNKRTIYRGGQPIAKNRSFNSIEDWNQAVFEVYLRVLEAHLGYSTGVKKLRSIIITRDTIGAIEAFRRGKEDNNRRYGNLPVIEDENLDRAFGTVLHAMGISKEDATDLQYIMSIGAI